MNRDDVVEAACRVFSANLMVNGWTDCPLGDVDDSALEAAMSAALASLSEAQPEEGLEPVDGKELAEYLQRLSAKATQGPWGIWHEPIDGKADKAICELTNQVYQTEPIGENLVLLEAGGKCPALTGCGPDSSFNAALISCLVNNLPTILTALSRNHDGER